MADSVSWRSTCSKAIACRLPLGDSGGSHCPEIRRWGVYSLWPCRARKIFVTLRSRCASVEHDIAFSCEERCGIGQERIKMLETEEAQALHRAPHSLGQ